jgi:F0F1-type ATP synthase assembly protein I
MEKWGPAARLIGVGFYIGVCLTGGALSGRWLDRRFDTQPIFMLTGLIVGLIFAAWGVYQMLLPLLKENKKERR